MDRIDGFGQAIRSGDSRAAQLGGSSRPRSAERVATERSLRADRDELDQSEAQRRGERIDFASQAREQHSERRARRLSGSQRERAEDLPTDAIGDRAAPQGRAAEEVDPATPAPIANAQAQALESPPAAQPAAGGASAPGLGTPAAPAAPPVPQAPAATGPAGPAGPSAAAPVASSGAAAPRADGVAAPSGQRSASVAKPAPAPSAQAAAPPVPTPEPEPILDQVRLQLQPGLRQATLSLSPAHLGRIAIRMELRDGEMTAVVRAERPETLASLQANLPELRGLLAEAGLDTGSIDLGLSSEGDMDFAEGGQGGRRDDAQRVISIYLGDEAEGLDLAASQNVLVSGHVDLYA